MNEFIAGLAGALVGASASVATVWIQTRAQIQQERLKMVQQLAMEEFKCALEQAQKTAGEGKVLPVTVYLAHHLHLAKVIERKGKIAVTDLEELNNETEKIIDKVQTFSYKKKNG